MSRAHPLMTPEPITHQQNGFVMEFINRPCQTLDGITDLLILTFINHAQFGRLNVDPATVSAYIALGELIPGINLKPLLLQNISTRLYLDEPDISSLISGITSHQEDSITRETVNDFAIAINQLRDAGLARERARRAVENEIAQAAERERARRAAEREIARRAVEREGERERVATINRQARRARVAPAAPPPTYSENDPRPTPPSYYYEPAPDYELAPDYEPADYEPADYEPAPDYYPNTNTNTDNLPLPHNFSDENLVGAIRQILTNQPIMNPYNTPMIIGAFQLTFEKSKKIGRSHNTNCFCRPREGQTHLGIKIIIHNEDEDRYKIRFLIDPDGISSRPRTEDQRDVDSLEALKTDIQNVRLEATPSTILAPSLAWMPRGTPETERGRF